MKSTQGTKLVYDRSNGVTNFDDDEQIPEYAKAFVAEAVNKGLINGREHNRFAPADLSTRAESTILLLRCVEYLKNEQ